MIFLLYGDDSFRSYQKVAEIKQKYLNSDKSGSGLSVFDCEEDGAAVKKIIGAIGTPNLLAPKRLVIVKNIILAGGDLEKKKLGDFLEKRKANLSEDKDLVLVIWEKELPKKSDRLFKLIEKNFKKQEFQNLSGAKLDQWILKTLTDFDPKAKISKAALVKLEAYCGNDTRLLDLELQKLANFASGWMITDADVEMLVKGKVETNIFQMVDALGTNDKKEALRILHERLEIGDDPYYIFSMFIYQFRNLVKISGLCAEGISSEFEISKITKAHPYVVRKSFAQIRNWSFARLKEIYGRILDFDTKVKTGKMDMKLALDKFVAEL